MLELKDLVCPYINKEKAKLFDTLYFCDFDGMEFDSMKAHCSHCEMYENMIKRNLRWVRNGK